MSARRRVVSGIQPTGKLHLGNYLGAISLWTSLQSSHDATFFIADLHALTAPEGIRAHDLHEAVRRTAATLLACGIDPEKATLFVQSHVSEHSELAWILSCVTPVGWLERMIQFKTRAGSPDGVGTGMLAYPVLQAADILLYRADVVPVGEDQRQHIELTRDIARRFHSLFGEVFTMPEALLRQGGARIMGLDEPTAKMSKSLGASRNGHAIGLVDTPDEIRNAVMRSVTDSGREVQPDQASPGIRNLLKIHELLSGQTAEESRAQFAGKGYSVLKRAVADQVITALEPVRQRYLELSTDTDHLDRILTEGAARARAVAGPTLGRAAQALGLRKGG